MVNHCAAGMVGSFKKCLCCESDSREREVGMVKSVLYTENWLSPAIQATWEARTEGWLEVQRPLPN